MARRWVAGTLPVEPRRHLLEPGTEWQGHGSASGPVRRGDVRVTLISFTEDEVVIARVLLPSQTGLPSARRISLDSFLRNYRRRDEA